MQTRPLKRAWRRADRGWPPRYPVAQAPNPPLAVALAAWVLAALTHGAEHDYARATFYAGLAAWAWGELAGGVNWFRRALGAAALIYVIVTLGSALG